VLPFQPPDATAGGGSSDPSQLCFHVGYARDPTDWQIFYQCLLDSGKFITFQFVCPGDLVFDLSLNVCNWRDAVPY